MDWKNIISELQAAGFSQVQIAEACGCSQSTVSELATGKIEHPRYAIGMALQDLLKRAKRRAARPKAVEA